VKTNRLGWTDLELTSIGLGTFPLGGGDWEAGWGPQDDKESIATIRRALELGKAEKIVSEAIGKMSNPPIIATKCGLMWNSEKKLMNVLKKKSVKKEAEDSLKRLKVDVIDLYQIHWPIPDEDIEEAWTAVAELAEEGKVRYGGVSNCSVAQMERLSKIHPIASLQPPYSMIIRDVEGGELKYCRKQRIGVIPYSPMQRGLLTGKYNRDTVEQLAPNDHRRNEPYFQEPEFGVNLKLIEGLRPLAEDEDKTLAQLALAWVLRRSEITAAIVGARRPSHLEETVRAGDWELDRKKIRAIDRLLKSRDEELARGS
jgi:aryl-alcohol dehydrogenase-like predicted oxidoreductase